MSQTAWDRIADDTKNAENSAGSPRRSPRFIFAMLVVLWSISAAAAAEPQAPALVIGPLSWQDSLTTFKLEPDLIIENVAAEPLVVAPCALAFDDRARLFVAENRGYPTGAPDGKPMGRVVQLVDADGDGRYDQRVEFAEGLTYPNGILPWRDGLIITCAPDILFLRDRDGDGRADDRKVLLTGFSTTGSTQLRVSHPTLGVDNWIYATSGLTGGNVTCPDLPDQKPLEIKRIDLRFRLDVDAAGLPKVVGFEPCDGGAQFGMSFDEFGRRFICYNRVQVQHVVLSSATLRRNPNLAFSETVQNCPADMSPEPVRGHGAAAKLFPLSQNVTTADSHAGTFTAACAVTVWRGTGLPDAYRGGAFSCDPTANVVHFDRLDPQGATFAARRTREGIEFLASPDNWFRPVYLAHGPDGSLYVCDMYRKTIEHPDYLPVEIRKRTDFESGRTMGRIWRVRQAESTAADVAPRSAPPSRQLELPALVAQLKSPEGWQQDVARRLLIERREAADWAPLLRALIADEKAPASSVVAALRLLDTFDLLDPQVLEQSLRHSHPAVREHVVPLMDAFVAKDLATWGGRLTAFAQDPDRRVRFMTAIGLGDVPGSQATKALAAIATRDADDRWLRAAVFSSSTGRESELLDAILEVRSENAEPSIDLAYELGRLLGSSQAEAAWPNLVNRIVGRGEVTADQRTALLTGLVESLRARGIGRAGASPLEVVTAADREGGAARAQAVLALVDQALATARDESAPAERRRVALGLVAQADYARTGETLLTLVDPRQPSEVQAAAVRALGLMRDERIAAALLDAKRFPAYTPRLREDVLSTMLSNPQHLPGLLTAIEQGVVPRGAVDSLRRRQLTDHRDPALRERARKLFDTAAAGNRAKVYDELKELVSLTADPSNGLAVFKKTCAPCHRLDREGTPVGPDLFGIRNQPKEAILLHIVIPEHEITPGFAAYVITTVDGRVLTGLIAGETPTSVTIRQALGKEETILRKDIDELVASRLSLMPQEIEKNHTRQELSDLIAYLKGEKPTQ